MTTQEKIDFIRSKCIEANPSILDLVFGCAVTVSQDGDYIIIDTDEGFTFEENGKKFVFWNNTMTEYLEILGRDIRLPDVLMAIRKGKYAPSLDFAVDPNHISIQEENTDADEMFCIWNLLQDRLEDQSGETIEFVYNLLANNK